MTEVLVIRDLVAEIAEFQPWAQGSYHAAEMNLTSTALLHALFFYHFYFLDWN